MQVVNADRAAAGPDEAGRRAWIARCEEAYSRVYRGLIAIGATADEAADAVQDAFEGALKQRTSVTSPDGWLFVVARRKLRRARWRRRIFHPLDRMAPAASSSEREAEIDLLHELERLTERQRTVIVLRYVLGLTQREIGELLNIAPGTVSATVHQVTTILRDRLKGELE